MLPHPALKWKFGAAMIDVYHEAARLGNRPTRFSKMVRDLGGVETVHRLLAADKIHDGLAEVSLLGRLDLTVEHDVLWPESAPLFTDVERRVPMVRLGLAES